MMKMKIWRKMRMVKKMAPMKGMVKGVTRMLKTKPSLVSSRQALSMKTGSDPSPGASWGLTSTPCMLVRLGGVLKGFVESGICEHMSQLGWLEKTGSGSRQERLLWPQSSTENR